MSNLKVDGLCFSYKEKNVLSDLSFQVGEGEFICVLGKNGAGKSTLFKCILGFLRDCSGSITVNGKNIREYTEREMASTIAYIPQTYCMSFSYNVLDVVMMGTASQLGVFQLPGGKQKGLALEALETVGIPHLYRRAFTELSGGEQQMVMIARAIAQQAKILLMDEPCSNLDYGNQIKLMHTVRELCKKGYIVLQTTHNPNQALEFAGKVLILSDGKAENFGRPEAVMTGDVLSRIYDTEINILDIPEENRKFCVAGRRK